MICIESSPHHQASAILESDFNTRVVCFSGRRLRHLHFQEFRCCPFAQPFLPHEEIRPAQTTFTAECSHSLPATRLLGNQLSPLRPCLLCSFGHVATLQRDTIFRKMGFVNRSPKACAVQGFTRQGSGHSGTIGSLCVLWRLPCDSARDRFIAARHSPAPFSTADHLRAEFSTPQVHASRVFHL
jgi:hypothetical protein